MYCVMNTKDFGTHLVASRWRSKVLKDSGNCVEVRSIPVNDRCQQVVKVEMVYIILS